eukprot:SM000035S13108  [mRNA]  locus=s35:454546:458080:- [translate_table: standard]
MMTTGSSSSGGGSGGSSSTEDDTVDLHTPRPDPAAAIGAVGGEALHQTPLVHPIAAATTATAAVGGSGNAPDVTPLPSLRPRNVEAGTGGGAESVEKAGSSSMTASHRKPAKRWGSLLSSGPARRVVKSKDELAAEQPAKETPTTSQSLEERAKGPPDHDAARLREQAPEVEAMDRRKEERAPHVPAELDHAGRRAEALWDGAPGEGKEMEPETASDRGREREADTARSSKRESERMEDEVGRREVGREEERERWRGGERERQRQRERLLLVRQLPLSLPHADRLPTDEELLARMLAPTPSADGGGRAAASCAAADPLQGVPSSAWECAQQPPPSRQQTEAPSSAGHLGKAAAEPLKRVQASNQQPPALPPAAAPPRSNPKPALREDDNTLVVNGTAYQKLSVIGKGGSSKVYKVVAPSRDVYALKRIRLAGRDADSARGFREEATLLHRLRGKRNIVQLIDSEVAEREGLILLVLEFGEIDLARLLTKMQRACDDGVGTPSSCFPRISDNFVRLYWQNMLEAVHTIHEERIVHSDLKPANFLLVEGELKLIDFGIARALQSDTTNIVRETQVGTLNYMSPEAIVGNGRSAGGDAPTGGIRVGRATDIWSLGCILYQMVYGQTPFSHLGVIAKLQAIVSGSHEIEFRPVPNPWLLDCLRRCLNRDPAARITIPELLQHPFLRPDLITGPAGAPLRPLPSLLPSVGGQALQTLLDQLASLSCGDNSSADLRRASQEIIRQLAAQQSAQGHVDTPSAASAAVEPPQDTHQAPAGDPPLTSAFSNPPSHEHFYDSVDGFDRPSNLAKQSARSSTPGHPRDCRVAQLSPAIERMPSIW